MSEESTAPVTEAPVPDTTPAFDAGTYFETDGSLRPDFQNNLDPALSGIAKEFQGRNLNEVFTKIADQRRTISQRQLAPPGPDSSEEERGRWRELTGVASSPEGALPEDMPEFLSASGLSEDVVKSFATMMHEHNAPQSAVQGSYAMLKQLNAQAQEAQKAQAEEARVRTREAMQKAYGADAGVYAEEANATLRDWAEKAEIPSAEIEAIQNDLLPYSPTLSRFMADVARMQRDAALRGASSRYADAGRTFGGSLEAQRDAISAHPDFVSDSKLQDRYSEITLAIARKANGEMRQGVGSR